MSEHRLLREQLCPGVGFSSVRDEKFRHNSISINIITPLSAEEASATALLPFLLRKGSRKYPDFTLLEQQLCELYGASLSSDIIKYGQQHVICYGISFVDDAYTLGGEIISDRCADLLCDMVLSPKIVDGAFDAADFALERQNLIDTIEAEINDKRSYAVNQCRAMLFDGSPLSTPRYGTVEGARAVTSQQTAARYARVMDTARIEITFVGCGDPTAAREKLRELFGALDRHPAAFLPDPLPTTAAAVRQTTQKLDVAQGKLVLGFRTGALTDQSAIDAAKLMTTLYGGTPSSRLFLNVREKLSLCYYCAARFERATGTILVDIGVERENRDRAQAAILAQLELLSRGEFEPHELVETKLACANSLHSAKDSLSAIESWYLAQILQGTDRSPDDEADSLNAVSAAAVAAAAGQVTLDSVYFLTGTDAKEDNADE